MSKLAAALKERQGDQSLRAVAKELGVAPGTAEGWLKAWRFPGYGHLPRLATYLDVPVDEIIRWIIEDDSRVNRQFREVIGLQTQPAPQLATVA